jgi:hypothetical protein
MRVATFMRSQGADDLGRAVRLPAAEDEVAAGPEASLGQR